MADLSVSDAARRLRLHVTRVRALLRAGDLKGRKVGGRWLVDEFGVRARTERSGQDGRPFSARRAWAYLLLLSGEGVPWIDPATRSRLRGRIREGPTERILPRLRRRARVEYFRAGPSALRTIAALEGFVASGVSAADRYEASVVARDQVDGYVREAQLRDARYRLALDPADETQANVILRVSPLRAALHGRKVAPPAAVAVDLMESADQRTRRAGIELAERLRADRIASR